MSAWVFSHTFLSFWWNDKSLRQLLPQVIFPVNQTSHNHALWKEAPFLWLWTVFVNCCWLMTPRLGHKKLFADSSWVSWSICFWDPPPWSQPPWRNCDNPETTILWEAWAMWGGPDVWNTLEKEGEGEVREGRGKGWGVKRGRSRYTKPPDVWGMKGWSHLSMGSSSHPSWCHMEQRWSVWLSSSQIPNLQNPDPQNYEQNKWLF